MKDFFSRNIPVFVIGFITLAIFGGIIYLAQKNETVVPQMISVNKDELISDHTYTKGNSEAKTVLVEFADYQCPACRQMFSIIKALGEKYQDNLMVAYRHFPLPQHTYSTKAAIAAQAAGAQGAFWQYSEKLYEYQDALNDKKFLEIATELGLDVEKFTADLNDEKYLQEVQADNALAIKIRLNATPSLLLNGELLKFSTLDQLEQLVVDKLKEDGAQISADQPSLAEQQNTMAAGSSPSEQQNSEMQNSSAGTSTEKILVQYSDSGFFPSNITANKGQYVVFQNTTDREIKIVQLISYYDQLRSPVTIKAGESFELQMIHDKIWTYKEYGERHYGSVYVVEDPTQK